MHRNIPFHGFGLFFLFLLPGWLMGCAIPPPVHDPIRDPNFQGPPLAVARARPEAYLRTWVRWGGVVARVDNRREETWVEIVEQPLEANGYPLRAEASAGRFLARFPGFLDPAIYAVGRSITVMGPLTGTAPGQVGDYRTTYLVVTVELHRLWPEHRPPEVIYVPDPFWYGPGYPWGYGRGFW